MPALSMDAKKIIHDRKRVDILQPITAIFVAFKHTAYSLREKEFTDDVVDLPQL